MKKIIIIILFLVGCSSNNSEKNIPIKEAQNLWEKKVTSVFVDDPTYYLEYF